MAKKGRAGPALAVAAIGSFIGGMIATMGLVVLALPLTKLALTFGPPEIFALLIVGLAFVTALANKSMVRAMIAAVLGMLIAQVGLDPIMGTGRYTFGTPELYDGFNIVAVIMGLFGIGEILSNAEARARGVFASNVSSVYLSREDMKASAAPIARGTIIGFPLGLIPGLGSMIPTFLSYAVEKRLSKTPEKFGTGMIEGVAGPETANNAYANAAMIPLFTLGIPSSPTIAVLMGAFMINGLIPGPGLFIEHSEFVWAVIASLVVGNAILLFLNLPLIPLWVQLLKVPYPILVSVIIVFCIIGVYSLSNSVFDIWVALAFGVVGYLLRKLDIPVAPLVLTLVLTPMIERALRQSLEMSNGNFGIFFERPLALTLLSVACAALLLSSLRVFRKVQTDSEI